MEIQNSCLAGRQAKFKILFITRPIAPPWDEASKNFAYYLARNLPDFKIGLLINENLKYLPDNIEQCPIYTSNKLNNYQKARLLKLISIRNKFDILHIMLTPSKLNSFCFKNFVIKKNHKVIQTIATLRKDLLSDSEIKKMLFGNLIVTYSDCAKNKLNSLGFKNVKRIYPGIDLDYYSPSHKNFRFLMNNNLRAEDFIVTYPGEYSRLGAIDDIVKVIKLLFNSPFLKRGARGDLKFILACRVKNKKDARKKEKVIKKLKKLNLLNKVIFIDTVPDMAKLYNSSDVILFPVRDMKGKFDVPLAVIEAMACGKPVIISDIPVLQEFANRQNSVIIKNGDAEKLSNAILDLYQNKTKRETIGKTARKYTEENFDIKKIAGEYQKIYESLGK
ncbi:glycosyltransferase family 4 protein [bacterium]|nr:glycosyltransferase family 4 protein [bacterium]